MPLRKWTKEEEEKLKHLYLETKTPVEEICRIIDRTPPAIQNRLKVLGFQKRRFPSRTKHPDKVTPALARIHAHICGDGYFYETKVKDCYGPWAKYRKKTHRIIYRTCYSNTNPTLIKEFQRDIKEVFGVKGGKLWKNEIRIKSKRIWDLLKKMGAGDSYNWGVGKEIINASKESKKNWIRAFFDDEAYFDNGNRIRVKCVNKKGLQEVTKILNEFVPCHLLPKKGSYWGNTYCININKKDVPKYLSKIGSLRYKQK